MDQATLDSLKRLTESAGRAANGHFAILIVGNITTGELNTTTVSSGIINHAQLAAEVEEIAVKQIAPAVIRNIKKS